MKGKNKKVFLIDDAIARIAKSDQDKAMLKRFFGGAANKPQEFLVMAKHVMNDVIEQSELLDDHEAVWIFALDGSESLCLASPALATQRICQKTHRLATLTEIGDRRRRNAK